MARYSGTRRKERRKLDRVVRCYGDASLVYSLTARDALQHAIRGLERIKVDGRTTEGKVLIATRARLRTLDREIGSA